MMLKLFPHKHILEGLRMEINALVSCFDCVLTGWKLEKEKHSRERPKMARLELGLPALPWFCP